MEGCDFNEAFPTGPVGSVNCLDRASADESRRQEKKKARKCRGPHANYLNNGWNMVGAVDTDPDRPSTKPMAMVPALNNLTGLTQHAPVTQQYDYETFVGSMDSLPTIRSDVAGPNALQKNTAPSFFGASPDDTPGTSLISKRGLTEGFQSNAAPFVDVIGEDESYKLVPDFAKTFNSRGVQKAGGQSITTGNSSIKNETAYLTPTEMMPNSILPIPNVDMFWKENGIAGGQSAFFSQLKTPGGLPSGTSQQPEEGRGEILTKLDRIFARLDDMDAAKSDNAQTEVLLFILTGLGVIFLMDVGCRAVSRR